MIQSIKKAALIISIVFALSGCGAAGSSANETSGLSTAGQEATGGQAGQPSADGPTGQLATAVQNASSGQDAQSVNGAVPGNPANGSAGAAAAAAGKGSSGSTAAKGVNGQAASASTGSAIQRPSGNRPQFEAADLMGEVAAVSGSKITVKVISMPAMGQGRRGGSGGNGAGAGWNGTGSGGGTSPGAIMQGRIPSNSSGQEQTSGGNDGGGSAQGNGQRPQWNVQYTGETKVLNISSGVEIVKTVRSDSGVTSQAIKLSEIKVGDILQVYYSDKSKETISKITLGGFGMG